MDALSTLTEEVCSSGPSSNNEIQQQQLEMKHEQTKPHEENEEEGPGNLEEEIRAARRLVYELDLMHCEAMYMANDRLKRMVEIYLREVECLHKYTNLVQYKYKPRGKLAEKTALTLYAERKRVEPKVEEYLGNFRRQVLRKNALGDAAGCQAKPTDNDGIVAAVTSFLRSTATTVARAGAAVAAALLHFVQFFFPHFGLEA